MSEAYIGEIRIFAGNFAPRLWATCDGQILSIADNEALFSLLGTTYGGDGRVSFGLPDMRGRLPVHQGQGSGLTYRQIGARFGSESVSLNINQLPGHTHSLQASTDAATSSNPANDVLASQTDGDQPYAPVPAEPDNIQQMNSQTLTSTGGGVGHPNIMPYQALNFIISLSGLYPSRS